MTSSLSRWAAPRHCLLSHPDHVRHVMQGNYKDYQKGYSFRKTKTFIGNGLLTSEGDFWLRQRRIGSPFFHRQRIAGFARMFTDSTEAMLERWEPYVGGPDVNVAADMFRLTLTIVAKASSAPTSAPKQRPSPVHSPWRWITRMSGFRRSSPCRSRYPRCQMCAFSGR